VRPIICVKISVFRSEMEEKLPQLSGSLSPDVNALKSFVLLANGKVHDGPVQDGRFILLAKSARSRHETLNLKHYSANLCAMGNFLMGGEEFTFAGWMMDFLFIFHDHEKHRAHTKKLSVE
jgi:hypothetical protein